MICPESDLRKTGVYRIRNLVNGKLYVGSASKEFYGRLMGHLSLLRLEKHHSRPLQHSWNKHGEDCFAFEVVEVCDPRFCVDFEQVYIDFYKSADREFGYNICPRAGSKRGCRLSPDHIEMMREASRGRKHTQEAKNKIGAAHLGMRHTDEAKAKVSRANKGRKMPPHMSELTRARFSGVPKSAEHRAKIGAAHRGRKKDPAFMAEITSRAAVANTGKKATESHIAAAIQGKKDAQRRRLEAGQDPGVTTLTIEGVTKTIHDWSAESGVGARTMRDRLSLGWSHKDVVFRKPRSWNRK